MEFETRRLIVKKFIPEYIGVMYDSWATDREVLRYTPEIKADWTIDDFADYIMRTYRNSSFSRSIIQEKDTHKIVGTFTLFQEDSRSKSVNIYIISDCWNRGYATEIMKSIVKTLKKEKIGSIYATCDGRNVGATRVCEKCEFELIDKIDNCRVDVDNQPGDEYLYELEL